MQFKRARFFPSERTIVQGACWVCDRLNISSFFSVISSHFPRTLLSTGLSFHRFKGSFSREENLLNCSARLTSNQNLNRSIRLSTRVRSITGTCSRNSRYCVGVQNFMTGSMIARLYQDLSNKTISPSVGSCSI